MEGRAWDRNERPPSAVEDYVKAIYGLEERGHAVTTATLAAELGVTPSSSGTLSHAASELFVERIARQLHQPVVDPHGDPIPNLDGDILSRPSQPLATLGAGTAGRLVRVWNGDPEVLRYLDSCGIELGDHIEVLRREPFGGPLMARVAGPDGSRLHGVSPELARVLSLELDQ